MKLVTRLTLFNTVSKLAIVLLFVFLLPDLVNKIVSEYTNRYLRQQQEKVLKEVKKNGIDYYLQGQDNYGSYTMLKEEYISLEPYSDESIRDTIETTLRMVEDDTLTYRVLRHVFSVSNKKYTLEVGKTTATIGQYSQPLQRLALYVLTSLIFMTILLDIIYTRIILKPLNTIITSRIINTRFPFKDAAPPVKTSTTDFVYLDRCLVDLMQKIKVAFDKEREFTSNASHELMTPISILQNKLENIMIDADLAGDTQEKILAMMNTLTRLKKIVQSLLFISRIENDQYAKSDTVNVSRLIGEVVEELNDRVEAKNLKLAINIPATLEVKNLNHDLVFQLFHNLANNAIRYNKEGGTISISAEETAFNGCTVYIEDTGVGIHEEDINLIFNRFKKLRRSSEDGYGLGLSIVKSIADYFSIQLEVKSVVDKGTTVSVKFGG